MRICTLSIHSFRGIPHELTLDLKSESTGKPVSMILFGDNGTGKSSVTDAIEFALQARIRGNKSLKQSATSAISFVGANLPSVQVSLSDGTSFGRSLIREESVCDSLEWSDTKPHSTFKVAPFVLRRADILRFIDTPDNQRQLIFFDYFRTSSGGNWVETPSETEGKINQERTVEKEKRRELLAQFAQRIGVDEPISANSVAFEKLVRERVYGGRTRNERARALENGVRIRV